VVLDPVVLVPVVVDPVVDEPEPLPLVPLLPVLVPTPPVVPVVVVPEELPVASDVVVPPSPLLQAVMMSNIEPTAASLSIPSSRKVPYVQSHGLLWIQRPSQKMKSRLRYGARRLARRMQTAPRVNVTVIRSPRLGSVGSRRSSSS
jgi:hypothetical protein